MKILFVVSRMEKPSARLRILAYLPFLKEQGFHCEIFEASRSFWGRMTLSFRVRQFDVCVIQKKLLKPLEIELLRKAAKKLIFDFDDAIIFNDEGGEKKSSLAAFEKTIRNADLVLCGNPYLKSLASQWNSRLLILPTPVDTTLVKPREPGLSPLPCIGWLGSKSTFSYFAGEEKAWLEIMGKEKVRFKVISSDFPALSLKYEHCLWQKDLEYELLKTFDIGLMPLPDNPFTRGKCAYKILQYQATGVPAIASPVGYNAGVIEHRKTGLLVSPDFSWGDAVRALIHDPALYREISMNARTAVEKTHCFHRLKHRFLEALRSA